MPFPFPIIDSSAASLPIHLVQKKTYDGWLVQQPAAMQRWLNVNRFAAEPASYCLLPDAEGNLAEVACGVDEEFTPWSLAHLTTSLPPQAYHLEGAFSAAQATSLTLGWALGAYRFDRYKTAARPKETATLVAPAGCDLAYARAAAGAIVWARDLINSPANDMHPQALADEAVRFAQTHQGEIRVITGEALLEANYPLIHAVGKASAVAPRMVDLRFARPGAPQVTLVGKGVCFDSGGLDIKSGAHMKLMKKDMGGAACALALARLVLDLQLPVQLRVLLPIVENAISGHAMRPLDIVTTRKGITVEIGNTDAEGRLILCDALSAADDEAPDLLIDCATLTGAARTALGTEIPAFFTPDDALAAALARHSAREHDPLWRLPLWKNYRPQLDSPAADISNDPDSAFGGAITAALYLQEFVSHTPSWLHIDMMAWNVSARPGRPIGGEVMAVRALYAMLRERYENVEK